MAMKPEARLHLSFSGQRLWAALMTICAVLSPIATSADGARLLVLHDGKAVQALAAAGDKTWFAVQPPPAWQPHPDTPPVFPPVHADGHHAGGSVVMGLWTRKGLKWLATLPGELAMGGRRVYGISDILPESDSAWVTGPMNLPERPIGRFYLARFDQAGRAGIEAEDDGSAAVALAAAPKRPCVARNPETGSPTPMGRIACPGGWSSAFRVTGPGAFLSWTSGQGLAPAGDDGVWAVAYFRGTVRVDNVEVRSPVMRDLPFLGDEDGGLPQAALAPLLQMLQTQPMPPLGAVMVVRLDGKGHPVAVTRLAPDAIRVGAATGETGMNPAVIDAQPLLDSDPAGRAFVFGRYEHAIRAGEQRIVTASGSESDTHCFIASWQSAGDLRWLRNIDDCTGQLIGLVADSGRIVAVTSHDALWLDPETGIVQARMALPRARRSTRPPHLRWTAADVAGDELVLGGTFRGAAEVLGQRLDEKQTSVIIARLPLAWQAGTDSTSRDSGLRQ